MVCENPQHSSYFVRTGQIGSGVEEKKSLISERLSSKENLF